MKTLLTLLKTHDSFAPLIARLTLRLVMFPHGAQKALGWFGGYGFSATMNSFTGQMHIPAGLAFLAIVAEFAGSIGLITGFLSRVAVDTDYWPSARL
jgi:putative oxidoreductase